MMSMKKHRTALLPMAALALLTACGTSEPDVTGTYKFDAAATFQAALSDVPEPERAAATPKLEEQNKMNAGMAITLRPDGTAEFVNDRGAVPCKWTHEGGQVRLSAEGEKDELTMTWKHGALVVRKQFSIMGSSSELFAILTKG